MATKKRIDWPQVVALAVVVAAVVALVLRLDPEKAEAWLALAPSVLAVAGMAWSMSRGKAVDASALPPRRPSRSADTAPPEAP